MPATINFEKVSNESLRRALQAVDSRLQIDNSVRTAHEQCWFTSYLNIMGFQWSLRTGLGGRLEYQRKQIRYRGNKLLSRISHTVADLVRHSPDYNISSDREDLYSATEQSVAERYLEYVFDKESYKRKMRHHGMTCRIFGTGIWTVYWDPESGDALTPEEWFTGDHEDDVEDLIQAFEEGGLTSKQAVRRAKKFADGEWTWRKGDIKISSITPYEFYPDPSAEDIESCQWVIHAKIRNIDWIKQRFGRKAKDVSPEDIADYTGPGYLYRIKSLVSPNIPGGETAATKIEDSAIVYEYWSRPSEDEPNGKHIIIAGGHVLLEEDNPYHKTKWQIPFTITRDNVLPHQFWGFASINDAISPQKAYNKFISMLLMIGHQHANAKWLVPKGSVSSSAAFNNRSEEVIFYNPIGANGRIAVPTRTDPPNVPAWLFKMLELADTEMEMQLGANELSMGGTPPAQTAAAAIQQLQEADARRSAALYEEMEESLKDLAMMILDISKIQMEDDVFKRELHSIVGKNKKAEVTIYTSADLNYRNISVELGASADRRREAKKQRIMEALQYKGIDPMSNPSDKMLLYDAIDMDKPYTRPEAVHESRALREHEMMDSGVPADVYEWHDDDVHIKYHYDRMNRNDWYDLPDHAKQAYIQHLEAHKHNRLTKMQIKALEQATLAGMAQPGGPVPGGPENQMAQPIEEGGPPSNEVEAVDEQAMMSEPAMIEDVF